MGSFIITIIFFFLATFVFFEIFMLYLLVFINKTVYYLLFFNF